MEYAPLFLVIGGYLLGGVMPAELAFRLKYGKRAYETGEKPGTFSVFRKIGFFPALLVLIFDAGKGFLPVWLAFQWNVNLNWLPLIAAAPAAGHSWPFLRWKYGGWALADCLRRDLGAFRLGGVGRPGGGDHFRAHLPQEPRSRAGSRRHPGGPGADDLAGRTLAIHPRGDRRCGGGFYQAVDRGTEFTGSISSEGKTICSG